MIDWTDRHDRFFLRQISRRALLYTEMITTGALIHGDINRHLLFNDAEHPVALQLGGADPQGSVRLRDSWVRTMATTRSTSMLAAPVTAYKMDGLVPA